MTTRVLAVFFVVTVVFAAQSQAPTPSARKREGAPANQQAQRGQQQPAADQRGTTDAPLVVQVLPTPKTLEEAAKEQADREQQSLTNRSTIGLTIVLALIGFAQLCVYGLQALRLRQTIEKMDEIAKGQAGDIAKSIAEATRAATAMEQVAIAMSKASDAAVEGNKINRESLIADQRPWIALDIEPIGPLSYDAEGWDAGARWHMRVQYRLRHVGKTPAIDVTFFGEMIPFVLAGEKRTDVVKEIEKVCRFPEGMADHQMGFGQVLFPGEMKTGTFHLNANPQRFTDISVTTGYSGQFLVVGGATYRSTLGTTRHRTAKVFHLHKRSGNQTINLDGEVIAVTDLWLTPHPFSVGNYAT